MTTKIKGNSEEDIGAPSLFDTLWISGLEGFLCNDSTYIARFPSLPSPLSLSLNQLPHEQWDFGL